MNPLPPELPDATRHLDDHAHLAAEGLLEELLAELGALVTERLPHISARPLVLPAPDPVSPLGSFAPLDEHTLLAAPRCSTPVPDDVFAFVEDRQGPLSPAYLKLWEALTRLGTRLGPGERFVRTLKFQGETDHAVARTFAELPGSWLLHLHHNKHELTPMCVPGVTDR